MKKEIWPNFFIVGAPRAGTSSLYEYLLHTTKVYMSPIKEVNYFCPNVIPDDFSIKPIRDKKKYLKLFQKVKDEKAIGEASPSYLRDPDCPKLIFKHIPHAKIIISLRNPINQIFSNYLMLTSLGWERESFRQAVENNLAGKNLLGYTDLVNAGMYSEQIKRFLDVFGKNQVRIIIFEEFIKEPKNTVKDILDFLEVDSPVPDIVENAFNPFSKPRSNLAQLVLTSGFVRQISNKIITSSLRLKVKENLLLKRAEKPKLSKDDKNFLKNLFREDVKKVERIIDKTLPWKIS